MADLAFIHPLLVRNPLPSDRLHAAVKQTATACAFVDDALAVLLKQPSIAADIPSLAFHESQAERRAHHWRQALLPSLHTCIDGVGHFAGQFNQALAALQFAATDMEVDPGARKRLHAGLALQRTSAAAQLAITRQVVIAIDSFRCTYARDFVAFVVDVDAARARLGTDPEAHLQFRQLVDERQRVTGDAMAAVASVIAALASIENAWSMLVGHFETLEAELDEGELSAAMLQARLNAARQDWSSLASITDKPPPLRGQAADTPAPPVPPEEPPALRSVSAFRSSGIGTGTDAMASAMALIDSLSLGIAEFPSPEGDGVLAVAHHIGAVKQLAQAWPDHQRPTLLDTLQALKTFSDAFVGDDAPCLLAAFHRTGEGDGSARERAVQLVAAQEARLAGLLSRFDALTRSLAAYLAQMATISAKLNGDTEVVTERLQAEHEQTQTLSAKAYQLQEQMAAANVRHRWHWLLGPLGPLVTHEIDVVAGNLRGVTNQLNEVRAAQAATMDDAAYLQSLLPALSTFLSGLDQLNGGIKAAMAGTGALRLQLGELKHAMLAMPGTWASASEQLETALDDWRAISSTIGQLPRA